MSNLTKMMIVLAMGLLGTSAVQAGWQEDAAHLSSEAGIDTKSAIDSFRNDIDKFQPPQPCLDKSPQTFTLGTPATLACGGGSPSGGTGGAGSASSSTIEQEQKGGGQTFDQMQ